MSHRKLAVFFSTFLVAVLTSSSAFAQAAVADNNFSAFSWIALAGGMAALGQGRAAAAALEGIARNPGAADKLQTPLLLSLAFMEALGILAFVIAFLLQGNISFG
jgi:F-type H+-transporting ATPase subunit c